ncbi:hypothetical protein MC28_E131 (plasmid) [Bacillus thuringiensis MC28]|nr:hypothetical protein MC28_E131 [Bacillus thuringiensis MC28]
MPLSTYTWIMKKAYNFNIFNTFLPKKQKIIQISKPQLNTLLQ